MTVGKYFEYVLSCLGDIINDRCLVSIITMSLFFFFLLNNNNQVTIDKRLVILINHSFENF